jgi:hypothetical protein
MKLIFTIIFTISVVFTLKSQSIIISSCTASGDGGTAVIKIGNLLSSDSFSGEYKVTPNNLFSLVVQNITSTISLNFDVSYKIFPIPSSKSITVVSDKSNETIYFQMFNLNGSLISSGKIVNNSKIGMHDLSAGVYLLKLSTNSFNNPQTFQIIKK